MQRSSRFIARAGSLLETYIVLHKKVHVLCLLHNNFGEYGSDFNISIPVTFTDELRNNKQE